MNLGQDIEDWISGIGYVRRAIWDRIYGNVNPEQISGIGCQVSKCTIGYLGLDI
jgi:hypothetical protein